MSHAGLFDRAVADRSTSSRDTITSRRRLSAILAADVAGYSRLMGADEERTLERLRALRRDLVDPKIQEHHGRIVKTTGDGMLVEFSSVVDAVRCAVELQRAMVDRNADVVEDKRIIFRIGINLGDVIAEGGDIYGDGVNVAARLEALAEPGGICISGTVWDHVRDKLPYSFEDMGEQTVKNIARPVRVYTMGAVAVASLPLVAVLLQTSTGRGRNPKPFLIVASAAAAVGLGIAVWWVWPHASPPTAPIQVSAAVGPQSSPAQVAVPAASLKTAAAPRLSIVVLPFSNLSNDPEQEYFVDGITDDLTTDLAQIPDSLVIARNTAFTYKGKAVEAKQVASELGVRYVLEGSVRRMGDQVQANVQLIDGETGAHVWADRFETDRRNLGEAQSQITGRLAQALHVELVQDAARRIERERSVNPDARDLVMRGWALWYRPLSVANRQEAQQAFERALEIDPRSIDARIGIALLLTVRPDGSRTFVQEDLERTEKLLREALELDAKRSMAHAAMGLLRKVEDRQAEAQAELETAIALDRNNAWAIQQLATTFMLGGQPEPCILYAEKALKLSPLNSFAYTALGKCHLLLGQVEEAMPLLRKAEAIGPGSWFVHLKLAGALGLKGEDEAARAELAEMVRLKPDMNSVARVRGFVWYRNPQFQVLHDRTIIQGLRNAGFPEEVAAQQ